MTAQELRAQLNSGRLNKSKIEALVKQLAQYPELVGTLLEEVFKEDAVGETFNASWVFDNVMRKNLSFLLPFLGEFINGLPNLKFESCLRPMAHVVELLNEAYFKKQNPLFLKKINAEHQEVMVTTCFDWLIGEHKVATKVFAMTSLFYLGEKFDWVRPELKSVIEQQIHNGTAGFKSRGGKTLKLLTDLGY